MKYLLDVNALLALLLTEHTLHRRTLKWVAGLVRKDAADLVICPITELGFLRILSHAAAYGRTLPEARLLLAAAKNGRKVRFSFQAADLDSLGLPSWTQSFAQVTDGYLLQLAVRHGLMLATLDEEIPGAFLIPRHP